MQHSHLLFSLAQACIGLHLKQIIPIIQRETIICWHAVCPYAQSHKKDSQPLVFFFVFSPTPRGKPLVFTPRWSEADWVGKFCRRSIKICRQISRCVRKYSCEHLSEWISCFKLWNFDTLLLSVFNHFLFSHAVFARISRRNSSIPDRG